MLGTMKVMPALAIFTFIKLDTRQDVGISYNITTWHNERMRLQKQY